MPIILDGTTGITTPGITNTGTFVFQGPVQVPAGSAATASITTAAGANTGIYFPSSSSVAITTAGTQRFVVSASGDVGIGTASPAGKLDVAGGTSESNLYLSGRSDSSGDVNVGNIYGRNQNASFNGVRFKFDASSTTGNLSIWTATGGTLSERFRITEAGNVGIGTNSPVSSSGYTLLTLNNATNGGGLVLQNNGTSAFSMAVDIGSVYVDAPTTRPIRIFNNGTETMRLTSSNNLLVGTTSAIGAVDKMSISGGNLTVSRTSGIQTLVGDNTQASYVGSATNHALVFLTNATERARIHSGGGLTIGGTIDDGILTSVQTAASVVQFSLRDDTNTRRAFFLGSGYYGYQWVQTIYANGGKAFIFANTSGTEVGTIVVNSGGTAYNTTSDYRLKDEQKPLTGSGAFIDAIKPKEWVWKSNGERGVGFIAHELAEVSPSSVSGEKDAVGLDMIQDENGEYVEKTVPKYQSVSYSSGELIANLVAEVQSLRARLAAAGI